VHIEFDNYVSIVTSRGSETSILLDDNLVTTDWQYVGDYAATATSITPGSHFMGVTPGSSTKFAAYVYGHSIVETSTSAYGFAAVYHSK
jgi:hypothetical protein